MLTYLMGPTFDLMFDPPAGLLEEWSATAPDEEMTLADLMSDDPSNVPSDDPSDDRSDTSSEYPEDAFTVEIYETGEESTTGESTTGESAGEEVVEVVEVVDGGATSRSFDQSTESELYDCPICLEPKSPSTHGVVALACSHQYCPGCFVAHMRTGNSCAMCRSPVCPPPKPKSVPTHRRVGAVVGVFGAGNESSDDVIVESVLANIRAAAKARLMKRSADTETQYVIQGMKTFDEIVTTNDIRKTLIVGGIYGSSQASRLYNDADYQPISVEWGAETYEM
jgi:hypothetical protein